MLPYKVGLRKNFIKNVQSVKVTEKPCVHCLFFPDKYLG